MSRAWQFMLTVIVFWLFTLPTAAQQAAPRVAFQDVNGEKIEVAPRPSLISTGPNEIIQDFPTKEAAKTSWKIHWATSRGYGLMIKDAWFRRAPDEPYIQIVGDIRLGEMFVPYHSGTPRFWDVSYNFRLIGMGKQDAGANGKILGESNQVVAEVKDRGVMWIDVGKGTRRGQSLVLWGCLDAANYRYIIEYGFQDDGVITARVGSTGRNYSSREFEGHMHHALWRVDVNLDGPENNSVYVMEHFEAEGDRPEKAKTDFRPFNQGKEGYEDWKAMNFTMLTVLGHTRNNVRGKPISYDVAVPRMGTARHYGPDDEGCTQHDFWVTKNRPGEMSYRRVPEYIKKGESVMNTDVVLWISSACHHEPRSEDGEIVKDSSRLRGATLVAWSGFELRPRNFFDRTPFYDYSEPPPPAKKRKGE